MYTINKSPDVSPFPSDDHKASVHRQDINNTVIHKRSTALERWVKLFTRGLKLVSRRANLTLSSDVDQVDSFYFGIILYTRASYLKTVSDL